MVSFQGVVILTVTIRLTITLGVMEIKNITPIYAAIVSYSYGGVQIVDQ